MTHRTVALAFALLLTASGIGAQQTNRSRTQTSAAAPPEVDVLAGAVSAISRMHMREFADSALWEAAIDGLLEALDDPYAEVFTPDESAAWEESSTGNYSGIGLQITQLNDAITVTAVFRGTPAEDVGIMVGDIIVGVGPHDASAWTTDMAADSIRGPEGTNILVKIRRDGFHEAMAFDITRAQVHVPAVHAGRLENDVGYVLLDRVARNAAREMDAALRELEDAKGLVIDLRRNPGGYLDESLMLADLFLEPGSTLASTVQRVPGGGADQTATESYDDRWPVRLPDVPIVVLVDGYTASGAEILAGALQDYDRALIVGERTFGKGVVQTRMPLPHGRALSITTGTWQTPLGRTLHRDRDREGRPVPEDLEAARRVTTPDGRELIDAGGIFPDLEIQDDTLTLKEREFLEVVSEEEYQLGLRYSEFAFEVANELRAADREPQLSDERFEDFLARLVEEGLPSELVRHPDVQSYLKWRVKMTVAQRMSDVGREADFRMERDPVLREAARLVAEAGTQAELFAAAGNLTTSGETVGRR